MGRWDQDVCERLVAGDEAALGELYDEFSPLVYGLAPG
jgi:RNA polymerase sigma-70 factor, ECF subfamily